MEILGIDIGGTGIKGAIVNIKTGELVTDKHRIPTPEGAKPDDVADVVAAMVEHFKWQGEVGCGFPSIVTLSSSSSFVLSFPGVESGSKLSEPLISA